MPAHAAHHDDHEIETIEEFDATVSARGTLAGFRVQAVDLTDRTRELLATDTAEAVFLGCPMRPEAAAKIRTDGALVFPPVPGLPFDPYRGLLYSPDELFASLSDGGYEATPDARAYAWFQRTKADRDVYASMLRAVHDDSVSDALDEFLSGARVVGVMGGHAMARGTEAYEGAARLGRTLARSGLTVATGGGPGAMEAANLGAYAAPYGDEMLTEALRLLAKAPKFTPSITDWASAAFEVRTRWPRGGASVGIPTWFYGHEPPNPFASHIAKYFANATREDGLLARCGAGVVFLPEPPEPFRRSSTTRPPTTTSRAANRPPWCSSTGLTGRRGCRPGHCCDRWRGAVRWRPGSRWSTGSRRHRRPWRVSGTVQTLLRIDIAYGALINL